MNQKLFFFPPLLNTHHSLLSWKLTVFYANHRIYSVDGHDTNLETLFKMGAHTCCAKPSVETVDGQLTCVNCGQVHSESHIVSEITFGESASGAAVVQGGFVGAGQRYARTAGPFRGGGGAEENREFTIMQARNEMMRYVRCVPSSCCCGDRGLEIFFRRFC